MYVYIYIHTQNTEPKTLNQMRQYTEGGMLTNKALATAVSGIAEVTLSTS